MNATVSIIIPIYNAEKHLCRCLDSVVNQTYRNIEIILVDDGSTDNSSNICDHYANSDDRITVIHKANGGLSSARNAGLNAIKRGEYIMFVDCDDEITLTCIEDLLNICIETECDLSVGGYYGIDPHNRINRSHIPAQIKAFCGEELLLNNDDNKISHVEAWGKLYKKSLWEDLRFPEGQIFEDAWIMPYIYRLCKKIVTCPQAVYHYYETEGSIMHSKKTFKKEETRLKLYKHLAEFYKEENFKKCYYREMLSYRWHYLAYKKEGLTFDKQYAKTYSQYTRRILFASTRYIRLKTKIQLLLQHIGILKFK